MRGLIQLLFGWGLGGHFGRKPDGDGGFSWEKTDLADTLRGMA